MNIYYAPMKKKQLKIKQTPKGEMEAWEIFIFFYVDENWKQ